MALGLLLIGGLVAGVVALWPAGEDADAREDVATDTTVRGGEVQTTSRVSPKAPKGEPSERTTTTTTEAPPQDGPADLFRGDLPAAYTELVATAGNPGEIIELTVYDTYAVLAYRDPANPANIDRRTWRDGRVDAAEPNIIDDRVDEDTTPKLFAPGELDPSRLAALIADAPSRYAMPVDVTHVVVNRFLPFDERVLIRVYAAPSDGRSGGGYVSYDTASGFVSVCC
jgi:hypothetical protein